MAMVTDRENLLINFYLSHCLLLLVLGCGRWPLSQ
jgi:hypothetical protein